jgi:hypothetical protein
MKKNNFLFLSFLACFSIQLRTVFFFSNFAEEKNVCVTNKRKYLAYASIRSIKCNRTRTIGMKSLRNLLYLVHRTNVVDSSRIKREKKKKRCLYLSIYRTLMPLIEFERQCVCERDPLPWQEAVTRSAAANETAIKRACSHFRRQNLRVCTYVEYKKEEKEERKKVRISLYFRETERIIFSACTRTKSVCVWI